MKILSATALLLTLAGSALCAPDSIPDLPAARTLAAQQNKPVLILRHGSDWLRDDAAVCSAWQKMSTEGLPVIFGQYDDRTGLKGDDRKKALPLECYNMPTVLLLTPDGFLVSSYEPAVVRQPEVLKAKVKEDLLVLPKFAELAAQARSGKGPEAAAAAGKALELLRPADAMRQYDLRNLINKQDPDDTTGYRALFGMDHLAMYDEMALILRGGADGKLKDADRDFASAEARIRKALADTRLKGERRQQWMAGLAYLQRLKMESARSNDRSAMIATLREIVAVDPTTEYGKGAAKLARYWDLSIPTVITGNYYTGGDQSQYFEKDWHVDVTPSVTSSGVYTFRLRPMEGGTLITRNYRLVINGKVVATAPIDPKTNTKSVELTVPELPAGAKVEVWLTAECRDNWMGCSGFIDMEKK